MQAGVQGWGVGLGCRVEVQGWGADWGYRVQYVQCKVADTDHVLTHAASFEVIDAVSKLAM